MPDLLQCCASSSSVAARSPCADLTLADTTPRVDPDHPKDLNGHHGVTITQGQNNLVQRWVQGRTAF
jgi:hypothetical protein